MNPGTNMYMFNFANVFKSNENFSAIYILL